MYNKIKEKLDKIKDLYQLLNSYGYTNDELDNEIKEHEAKSELFSSSINNFVTGKRKRMQKQEFIRFMLALEKSENKIERLIKNLDIHTNMSKYKDGLNSQLEDYQIRDLIKQLEKDLQEYRKLMSTSDTKNLDNPEFAQILYSYIKKDYALNGTSSLDSLRKSIFSNSACFEDLLNADFYQICEDNPEYRDLRDDELLSLYLVSYLSDGYVTTLEDKLEELSQKYSDVQKDNNATRHKINTMIKYDTDLAKKNSKVGIKHSILVILPVILSASLVIPGYFHTSDAIRKARTKYIYGTQVAQYSTQTQKEETVITYDEQNIGDIVYRVYNGNELLTYSTHNSDINTAKEAYEYLQQSDPTLISRYISASNLGFYETVDLIKSVDFNDAKDVSTKIELLTGIIHFFMTLSLVTGIHRFFIYNDAYLDFLEISAHIHNLRTAIKLDKEYNNKYKKELAELDRIEKQWNDVKEKCDQINSLFEKSGSQVINTKELKLGNSNKNY